MTSNPERTEFGERTVAPAEKTALVRGVFDSVADNYDIMNDLMSAGVHRLWKDGLSRRCGQRARAILDVAGGTGDIAFPDEGAGARAAITVFDLNAELLRVGRDRAIDREQLGAYDWQCGKCTVCPSLTIMKALMCLRSPVACGT